MRHCIGVFSDAVAFPCKLIIEEHCLTEYGQAVAQVIYNCSGFPDEKSFTAPPDGADCYLEPSPFLLML